MLQMTRLRGGVNAACQRNNHRHEQNNRRDYQELLYVVKPTKMRCLATHWRYDDIVSTSLWLYACPELDGLQIATKTSCIIDATYRVLA